MILATKGIESGFRAKKEPISPTTEHHTTIKEPISPPKEHIRTIKEPCVFPLRVEND